MSAPVLAYCGWCGGPLGRANESGEFCTETHQRAWYLNANPEAQALLRHGLPPDVLLLLELGPGGWFR